MTVMKNPLAFCPFQDINDILHAKTLFQSKYTGEQFLSDDSPIKCLAIFQAIIAMLAIFHRIGFTKIFQQNFAAANMTLCIMDQLMQFVVSDLSFLGIRLLFDKVFDLSPYLKNKMQSLFKPSLPDLPVS